MLLQTPKEIAYDTAQRFRRLRRRRKITIRALSEQTGIPYSTLRRFEHDGEISFVSLVKLASALDEEEQIQSLFADIPPHTMEEVLRDNRR